MLDHRANAGRNHSLRVRPVAEGSATIRTREAGSRQRKGDTPCACPITTARTAHTTTNAVRITLSWVVLSMACSLRYVNNQKNPTTHLHVVRGVLSLPIAGGQNRTPASTDAKSFDYPARAVAILYPLRRHCQGRGGFSPVLNRGAGRVKYCTSSARWEGELPRTNLNAALRCMPHVTERSGAPRVSLGPRLL